MGYPPSLAIAGWNIAFADRRHEYNPAHIKKPPAQMLAPISYFHIYIVNFT